MVGVNELMFTEVIGALLMCLLSGSSYFSVTIILLILSMKNSLNSFAKSHGNGVGGNGNCLFLKSSLFVILDNSFEIFPVLSNLIYVVFPLSNLIMLTTYLL